MAMVVQHNMSAMNATRNLGNVSGALSKSTEKLSSGYRINRAGDDAAGLAISEKMRGQINGLNRASTNAQDGISLIQTAEGALTETHSILQRMRELAVQAASDTNTDDDRTQIQNEIDQLTNEVDRIASTTEFNTMKLLDGSRRGAVSAKDGNAYVEGTFTNSLVSAKFDFESGKDGGDINFTDILRIEVIQDFDAKDTTGNLLAKDDVDETTLDELTNGVAQGNIPASEFISGVSLFENDNMLELDFDGTDLTISVYQSDLTSVPPKAATGSDPIAKITIANADKLKAGDVITFTANAAVESAPAATGEESLRLQIGANAGQEMNMSINSMKAKDIGIAQNDGTALDVTSQSSASLAINAFDLAIQKVSTERAKMGAVQNRLEHTISNLDTSAENLQAAESRIRDTDMAEEMTNYSKNNILQQAGQSMLAQANQSTQGVLSLLQ